MTTEPLSLLTDAELQARIERFSAQMLEAAARFEQRPFDIADRAERDRCWVAQRALLKERARRKGIVKAMEEGRGLA